MKNRKASGYVSPSDLGELQVTFDALLAKYGIDRSDFRAEDIATTLLVGHSSGISGHNALIRYVEEASALKVA